MKVAAIFEQIAAPVKGEDREITHARRFTRRGQRHGITFQAFRVHPGYIVVRWGDRAARIDRDGRITQSASYNDPHQGAHWARFHPFYMQIAAYCRKRGRIEGFLSAMGLASQCRAAGPSLPA